MDARLRRTRSTLRVVVNEMRSQEISFMAGSVAYHAFVSLLPVLVLLMLLVSAVGGEALSERILALAETYLPEIAVSALGDALRGAARGVGASVVGVGVLLWGTFKIFRELDAAFSEIYDVDDPKSLPEKVRDATAVFVALVVAVAVAVTVGPLVSVPGRVPLSGLLEAAVATVGLAAAFVPMYYVFPDVDLSWREVVPGVLVAAVGWSALQWAFRLYVNLSGKADLYGLAGALLLLVTWLYVSAFVLLLGGSVNAALAGRTGNRAARAGRRFGSREDRLADVADFERRVVGLVTRARDAGISAERLGAVLDEQADRAADADGVAGGGSDGDDVPDSDHLVDDDGRRHGRAPEE